MKLLFVLCLPIIAAAVVSLAYGFAVCERMTDQQIISLPKRHFCAAGKIGK